MQYFITLSILSTLLSVALSSPPLTTCPASKTVTAAGQTSQPCTTPDFCIQQVCTVPTVTKSETVPCTCTGKKAFTTTVKSACKSECCPTPTKTVKVTQKGCNNEPTITPKPACPASKTVTAGSVVGCTTPDFCIAVLCAVTTSTVTVPCECVGKPPTTINTILPCKSECCAGVGFTTTVTEKKCKPTGKPYHMV